MKTANTCFALNGLLEVWHPNWDSIYTGKWFEDLLYHKMNIISSSMWSIFLCKVYFFILVCENWQALCLYSNLKPDSSYTVENDHICTHRLSSRESIRLSHFPSHVVNIILWQEGSQVQNLSAESIRDFFTVNSLPLRKIGLIHRSIKEDRLFYVTRCWAAKHCASYVSRIFGGWEGRQVNGGRGAVFPELHWGFLQITMGAGDGMRN